MSKRDRDSDEPTPDGPPAKMMREDLDESGGGRTGRVRKKSAKVLEMEEFEHAEKVHQSTKKGKQPKATGQISAAATPDLDAPTPIENVPSTGKKKKSSKALSAGLVPVSASTPVTTKVASKVLLKAETDTPAIQDTPVSAIPVAIKAEAIPLKGEDGEKKSVIKYLLSSPTAGSKQQTIIATPSLAPIQTQQTDTPAETKKATKKSKTPQDKSTPKAKPAKKVKLEIPPAQTPPAVKEEATSGSLKMKIISGSSASTAVVTPAVDAAGTPPAVKIPKVSKKVSKKKAGSSSEEGFSIMSPAELEAISSAAQEKKAKKFSKKKEKLIQEAVSAAAKQMPNLAALVATPGSTKNVLSTQSVLHKVDKTAPAKKAKVKFTSPDVSSDQDSLMKSEPSFDGDDDEEESTLVIAETEKKKKKVAGLKKKGLKEKPEAESPQDDSKKKKIPKRPPTAYMLFCNTHRPTIVSENPGIEFAGISRKLGELWSTLSSKQKLQWKRKAQRRMKKGSNLISTGKGGKDGAGPVVMTAQTNQANIARLTMLSQKLQKPTPDDTPQSPNKNLGIEPIDVSAHLKLLGESLSIIGMRLQEHKGMIAVQGSLSVLLDSLLCSCGPLLCLTQQVPGMDGCSPAVHTKTLDSIAYVMPGL